MSNSIPKIDINTIEFLTSSKEVITSVKNFIEEWNNESNTVELLTSGSTGFPKKIVHRKENLLASARATGAFFNFHPNDSIFLCLPTHTIGGKMQVVRALIHGMKLVVGNLTRNPVQDLDRELTFCSFAPIQLEKILEECPEKIKLIGSILLGGSMIPVSLVEKIKRLNLSVYEGFGMTETISHIALRKVSENDDPFICLPGVTVSQRQGKLVIKAPHLGLDHLETTDEIELISPTSFKWKGRTDFVINSGGYKFHPEILEQKISPYIPFPFFIIGEPNPEFNEIVSLFVETVYSSEKEKQLNITFQTYFSPYEKPKKIHFTDQFSYTASGKINRKQTQKNYFESQK